jgi:hypothetical protein
MYCLKIYCLKLCLCPMIFLGWKCMFQPWSSWFETGVYRIQKYIIYIYILFMLQVKLLFENNSRIWYNTSPTFIKSHFCKCFLESRETSTTDNTFSLFIVDVLKLWLTFLFGFISIANKSVQWSIMYWSDLSDL